MRGMEGAISQAQNYFIRLMDQNVPQKWSCVFNHLRHYHGTSNSRRKLCSTDFKLNQEKPQAVWALDTAKNLLHIGSQYLGRGTSKDLIESLGTWFQTPKPESTSYINYEDAAFQVAGEQVHCYFTKRSYQV